MHTVRSLRDDVRWGVREALWFIGFFTLIGLVGTTLRVVRGEAPLWWFLAVPLVYLIGGVCAGGIVGVLRPWSRTAVGAVLTGILAMVPVAIAIRILIRGLTDWGRVDAFLLPILCVWFGTVGALSARHSS